jgi:phosphoribosylamine--glycine ligase
LKDKLKVLLIGSGGREHALADAILKSSHLNSLKVFPGNGGFPEELLLSKEEISISEKESFL